MKRFCFISQADSWFVEKAGPVVTEARGPMYTRWLGLRFQAHKRYFQSADSTLHLRCTARVGDLPPQHADFYPHLSSRLTNEKLAQERFGNQGSATNSPKHKQSTLILQIIQYNKGRRGIIWFPRWNIEGTEVFGTRRVAHVFLFI